MKKIGLILLVLAVLFCTTSCTQYMTKEAEILFNAGVSATLDIAGQLAGSSTVPGAKVETTKDETLGSLTATYTYDGCSSVSSNVTAMKGYSTIITYPDIEGSADGVFRINLSSFKYDNTETEHKLLLEAAFTGAVTPESVDDIYYTTVIIDGAKYYPPQN